MTLRGTSALAASTPASIAVASSSSSSSSHRSIGRALLSYGVRRASLRDSSSTQNLSAMAADEDLLLPLIGEKRQQQQQEQKHQPQHQHRNRQQQQQQDHLQHQQQQRQPLRRRRRLTPPFILVSSSAGAMALFLVHRLLTLLSPCLVGPTCYRGYQSEYSFDAADGLHPRWMAGLRDELNVTSLSIPGTHDTMTYDIGTQLLQCQNRNLSAQLRSGLRYFDIRARLRDDELHIYHANGYTGFSYEDVLVTMFAFLDENPSEAILMRLKEEGRPLGDRNTLSFEDALHYHHATSPSTGPGSTKHIHRYNASDPIPTLGALRSKILILQDFDARGEENAPYGLRWEGPRMVLEDLWVIPDVYHLSEKWNAIRDALEKAALAPDDNSVLYLAHLSASVGVLPIEAAAGPMNRTIQGMNDMTGQYLDDAMDSEDAARIGVVICDFPGRKLIEKVLAWNDRLK